MVLYEQWTKYKKNVPYVSRFRFTRNMSKSVNQNLDVSCTRTISKVASNTFCIHEIFHLDARANFRQYKNDSIQSTKIPILKLPLFFPHLYGKGKSAVISKLEPFLSEWSRSYLVFALEQWNKCKVVWRETLSID